MVLINHDVVFQNATLRQQFTDLKQRYTRAKLAIKDAQNRLDENYRRKQELRQQQKNNDKAIAAESNLISFAYY